MGSTEEGLDFGADAARLLARLDERAEQRMKITLAAGLLGSRHKFQDVGQSLDKPADKGEAQSIATPRLRLVALKHSNDNRRFSTGARK